MASAATLSLFDTGQFGSWLFTTMCIWLRNRSLDFAS